MNQQTTDLSRRVAEAEDKNTTILLSRGFVTIVDAIDFDLKKFRWNAHRRRNEFSARRIKQTKGVRTYIYLHRVILERMLNRPMVKGECADHINGDTLDNRRSNLRLASVAENNRNSKTPSTNSSGFKGVSFKSNKWVASISINGKNLHLGYYHSPEEAHKVYCEAAIKYYGKFAKFK